MEEAEDPTEHLQEEVHHHAQHSQDRWITQVALTSALLAVLAAISSLLSGHHANEAMMEQINAANQWAYYQAKGIKANLLSSKMEILAASGAAAKGDDEHKLDQYHEEQEKIAEQAKEKEESAKGHLAHHMVFARGVTLFQVAIAVAAISALLRRRPFWFVGLGFGVAGAFFLVQGLLMSR
jgi:hypothetical protein